MSSTCTPHTTSGRREAAAIIRGIAARRHRGRPAAFVCARCHVSWRGAEADCWCCGQPATTEHSHRGAALQRLLHPVRRRAAR
ncbi:hypothetical protein [Streptomyces sp. WMMC1477]|uniref:hypothetical protein n=1 Tax=Streptomyces sp. WMMC1477 TaxID=3015155 RepID=UPI0022B600BA|nr:hypothetical protein [Streptomyces sp. WMMC1477]MCZ7430107.1 hypothetical protein [Streptomyces sp. WMMC1477]